MNVWLMRGIYLLIGVFIGMFIMMLLHMSRSEERPRGYVDVRELEGKLRCLCIAIDDLVYKAVKKAFPLFKDVEGLENLHNPTWQEFLSVQINRIDIIAKAISKKEVERM